MDPNNPLAGKTLDLRSYLAANHASVTYGDNWRPRYLVELDALGEQLNTVLSIPGPENLASILNGSDLISTVPERIAISFGDQVHIAEIPGASSFEIDLFWTSRTHSSAMHLWLRQMIANVATASAR